MYVLWARGKHKLELKDDKFPFPKVYPHDSGMQMLQLLRADKLKIPET